MPGHQATVSAVIEYTGGSTGVPLTFVCALKRYPLHIVTPDAYSQEERDHMEALGAEFTLVTSPGGGTTKGLTLDMIETARKLSEDLGGFWTDQLNSADQLSSYYKYLSTPLYSTG